MATLPPPPSAAKMQPAPTTVSAPKPVAAAPVAQAPTPVAAEVASETSAPVAGKVVWGDKTVPVPTFNGIDPIALINELAAFVSAKGVDLAALVETAKGIPKTSYPGNKYGRAAYSLGNMLSALSKASFSLTRTRAARTPGTRVSKTEKFKSGIELLAAKFGGMDAIKATLGADLIKSLGL